MGSPTNSRVSLWTNTHTYCLWGHSERMIHISPNTFTSAAIISTRFQQQSGVLVSVFMCVRERLQTQLIYLTNTTNLPNCLQKDSLSFIWSNKSALMLQYTVKTKIWRFNHKKRVVAWKNVILVKYPCEPISPQIQKIKKKKIYFVLRWNIKYHMTNWT